VRQPQRLNDFVCAGRFSRNIKLSILHELHLKVSDLTTVVAQQPGPQQQATSLYIKNLPPEADKLYLYEHFARFGGISSVKVASTLADSCALWCSPALSPFFFVCNIMYADHCSPGLKW